MSRLSPSILHVCTTDKRGGAAIAAHRLVAAQRAAGMDARMLVLYKSGEDDWVIPAPGHVRLRATLSRTVAKRVLAAGASSHPDAFRTMGLLPTGLGAAIRRQAPDIVNFHWLGAEAIGLSEIAGIGIPATWTCHDEWAWCGAEHYATDDRYREGYAGADVDAKVFVRKRREWASFHPVLIGPSRWIARRAASSVLQGRNRAVSIPNTLDTQLFAPLDQQQARAALGFPADRKIVLFGAQGGAADPRKGFDLLEQALRQIASADAARMLLLSFGGSGTREYEIAGIAAREVGHVDDEATLARLYNAADVFVAPSRMDNLPNTLVEAQACGTPCIAFDTCGLPDLFHSPEVGELVPAFDCTALAKAIVSQLAKGADPQAIRAAFLECYAPETVARLYADLYDEVLRQHVF